ncbi:secretion-regulating guanine nucleotide exchange factor isoform X8 [Haemorhous mexicanus]|uniref:secretion-regulating guanine nucleotide exchange factor isoform X8 n=1 Tax=Haemorhous mexicanus TaxID=30427 RepID=UPI0028BED004|nr:secretion-regulating guanine nucleotide exchange factor isoform X8 [Haemorhous mexicanus]
MWLGFYNHIRSGLVLSCGSNSFGQLGLPQISGPCLIPQKIESLKEKVVSVAAGLRHALAATDSGLVLQWGTGMASQAKRASQGKALPVFLTAKEPCEVAGLADMKVKAIAAGSCHSVSLTDEGHLYVWGSNKHGQLVSRNIFLAEPKKIDPQCFSHERIGAVWSGWTHLVARTETGRVFTWGRVDYGQLGRHVVVPSGQQDTASEQCLELWNTPVSVPCLNGASQIACGSEHNLAIVDLTGACFVWQIKCDSDTWISFRFGSGGLVWLSDEQVKDGARRSMHVNSSASVQRVAQTMDEILLEQQLRCSQHVSNRPTIC